jgi:DNA-directed RNA polymerase specialized sigma24 family protein
VGRRGRGGRSRRLDLDADQLQAPTESEDLLALDEALGRLADEESVVAEVVTLRYFAGLTVEEVAVALGFLARTATRHWAYARAWLYQRLRGPGEPGA